MSAVPETQRHATRMRELEQQHRESVDKLKRDADQRIAADQTHRRHLVAESHEFKRLLREESMERRRQNDRVELESRRGHRAFLAELGTSLSTLDRQQWIDEIKGELDESGDPFVQRWSKWLEDIWSREGIDVRICADLRLANASAARQGKFIEIPPLRSRRACLLAGHETGHVCHPSVVDEHVVKDELNRPLSVSSEVASWRWLVERCPAWSVELHNDMSRFLNSYRSYATDDQKKAIDELCSPLTRRAIELRILKGV